MTTRPEASFITSVDVRQGPAHDYVTIWIRHANVGTLCVGKGDGEQIAALLDRGNLERADAAGAAGFALLGGVREQPRMRALGVMPERQLTRCPINLVPDECTLEVARGQGFDDGAIAAEVSCFVDYYNGQGVVRFDWQSMLRSWFRRRRTQIDDARQRQPVPFVLKGPLEGAPSAETIPQQLDRIERAREVTRRLHATLDAEQRETDRRMVERAGNWMAPTMLTAVGPVELSGHEPPPGNWVLFEGPREVIDSLLAQHDHTTAEAGPGAPAPSPPAANEKPGLESRPPGVPHAAGAPPTMQGEHACTVIIDDPLSTARQHAIEDSWRDEGWRDEETQG